MKHSTLPLKIDTNLPLSVSTQIKNQIKVLIAKNFLNSGDFLPSTNQLAQCLSVNKNTIQSTYSQLKDDGLLITGKGKGAQVADSQQIEAYLKDDNYLSLIQNIVEEVVNAGYNVEDTLLSGIAYNQLFAFSDSNKKRFLFIECKQSACQFYLDEIKVNTDAVVNTIDLDEPKDKLQTAIKQADMIITQNDLLDRVRSEVDITNKKAIGVTSTKDISLLFEMIQGN